MGLSVADTSGASPASGGRHMRRSPGRASPQNGPRYLRVQKIVSVNETAYLVGFFGLAPSALVLLGGCCGPFQRWTGSTRARTRFGIVRSYLAAIVSATAALVMRI